MAAPSSTRTTLASSVPLQERLQGATMFVEEVGAALEGRYSGLVPSI